MWEVAGRGSGCAKEVICAVRRKLGKKRKPKTTHGNVMGYHHSHVTTCTMGSGWLFRSAKEGTKNDLQRN